MNLGGRLAIGERPESGLSVGSAMGRRNLWAATLAEFALCGQSFALVLEPGLSVDVEVGQVESSRVVYGQR